MRGGGGEVEQGGVGRLGGRGDGEGRGWKECLRGGIDGWMW